MESLQPPWRGRLGTASRAAVDCCAAALSALAAMLLAWKADGAGGLRWVDGGVVAVWVLVAPLQRRFPRSVLALSAAAGLAGPSLVAAAFAAFAVYAVPTYCSRRQSLAMLAGSLVVTAATLGGFLHAPYSSPLVHGRALALQGLLLVTAAWALGHAVHRQRLYTAGLHERAERNAAAVEAATRRALTEERLRIARELHDVVAHTMSVIAVQAGVAHHVAERQPQEARRALSSIEESSRGALREMRALLGILRDEDVDAAGRPAQPTAESLPAPGLADLATLVERAAEGGVTVTVSVSGRRPQLSAGLDLAAFRVVQEAVTNVIKHAPGDRCQVRVRYEPDQVTVEVVDQGQEGRAGKVAVAAARTGHDGPGHGIIGMRERVAVYGGRFTADRLPSGGFMVSAVFPVTTGAAR